MSRKKAKEIPSDTTDSKPPVQPAAAPSPPFAPAPPTGLDLSTIQAPSIAEVAAQGITAPPPVVVPTTQADLLRVISESLGPNGTLEKHIERDEIARKYMQEIMDAHPISSQYNILIIHDETRMMKTDADNVYSAIQGFKTRKPILLMIYSSGGSIESAYLIGKLCREHCKDKFVVAVPREAKSAATLLCCAADEIHMGSFSELGPIDPQINEMPALGLKSTVEHLAELVKTHPEAADMFAKYLSYSIKPVEIGYYERVAESAMQYAEILLNLHQANLMHPAEKTATELVYKYKDHGFVIDKSEATNIFGAKIVKINSDEYNLGNALYQALAAIRKYASWMNHSFWFIGTPESKGVYWKRK